MLFGTESLELEILDKIQQIFKSPFMDFVMPKITFLGNAGMLWIVICLVLLFSKRYRKTGITMALSLVTVLVVGLIVIKPLIMRPRPFMLNHGAALLISAPKDFSFPSGHTLASFTAALVLFDENKAWGTAALILAALIAFSRLYLYVHFPTDIAAGIVLAILIKSVCCRIIKRAEKRKIVK